MSAAAERAALAAIGRDLMSASGGRAGRRAAALTSVVGAPPPTDFATLVQVPHWLRLSPERRMVLARLVALRSVAPTLAGSIDGAWLGALAQVVGEPALDWAIASAGGAPSCEAGRPVPGDLARIGTGILAAQLPPALQGYLPLAEGEPGRADPEAVEAALALMAEDHA